MVAAFDIACGQCSACHRKDFSGCDSTNPSKEQELMYNDRCSICPLSEYYTSMVTKKFSTENFQLPVCIILTLWILSCRTCGMFGYSHMTGGWEGGQAEYVRIPFGKLTDASNLIIDSSEQ